MLFHFLST